jgi:low temperature requirement protein LtrA
VGVPKGLQASQYHLALTEIASAPMANDPKMWSRPVIRSIEPGHRQATWAELFFDLIFVVAVAQLATFLLHNVTFRGAAIYALAYLPVWLSWVFATLYSNRFDTDDLGQRLITFAQMLAVAAMAASIAEETGIQFAVALAAFRLLVALSYSRVRAAVPAAVPMANRLIIQMLVSAGIWIASTFVEGNVRLAFWAAAILVELAVALVPKWQRLVATVPLHLSHLPERFGLFTIIVLGETVLAVVIGVSEAHWAASAAIFGAVGLTISFSLWWIYFETVTARAMHNLGGFRPIGWILAHAPLVMGITALGVGIEIAVHFARGEELHTAEALVLGGSLCLALLSLGLIGAADKVYGSWVRAFMQRLPAAVLVFVVALLPISAQAVLTILAIITAAQATYDVWASRAHALTPAEDGSPA